MTFAQLILYMMIGTPTERAELKARWKTFCEKHLIADDPYDEQTRKHREKEKEEQANDDARRDD